MKSDSQDLNLEKLLREITTAASANERVIDEVASSAQVWKRIQQQIRRQQPALPYSIASIRRFLLLGVPAAAAAILMIAFFVSPPTLDPSLDPPQTQAAIAEPTETTSPAPGATRPDEPEEVIAASTGRKMIARRNHNAKKLSGPSRSRKPAPLEPAEGVIRTEFIALSYARDPESGQIVRVKVPRSMMVTVGLVASVEKPMSLVDAEVLIGDDGLTRAIRFIR